MKKHGFELIKMIDASGGYRIDSTGLVIQRYEAKKYGQPAEWDVVDPALPDRALVTGKSLDDACFRLARLRYLLRSEEACPVKGAACSIYKATVDAPTSGDDHDDDD